MRKSSPELIPDGWLTAEEAREKLGRSQSTLDRMASAGECATKLQEIPGRKPQRLYSRADIEAAAAEAERVSQRAAERAIALRPIKKLLGQPDSIAVATNDDAKPEAGLPWISIEEAARASGLTEHFVHGLIEAGKIIAVRGGPHGAWRVHRRSLVEDYRG